MSAPEIPPVVCPICAHEIDVVEALGPIADLLATQEDGTMPVRRQAAAGLMLALDRGLRSCGLPNGLRAFVHRDECTADDAAAFAEVVRAMPELGERLGLRWADGVGLVDEGSAALLRALDDEGPAT